MRTFFLSILLAVCVMQVSVHTVSAAPTKFFDRVLRKTVKVSDDIPIHGADDLVKTVNKDAVEKAAKRIVKSADITSVAKAELRTVDPSLVRFADELDKPSKEYLLVLADGAKTCEKNLPDIASRGKFLERGGADTVTAIGMYGDEIAHSAMRVDTAIQGGKLGLANAACPIQRAVTTADFGRLFTKYGERAQTFWTKYVTPHWGKWLGGGALAWYLLDPEGFMDTAGALTEEGLKRLTQCVGDVAAVAISGVSKGLEHAAEATGNAAIEAVKRFIKTVIFSLSGFIGSVLIILGIAVALPFTRYYVLKPFRFLFHKPKP